MTCLQNMKATKAEIQKRVDEIWQIRLAGAQFVDIRQYAAENGWEVSDRQLWRYIRKSDQLLARTLERDREKLFNLHVAKRHMLFARAMQVSDYRTALAVQKDLAEMQGMYPAATRKISQEVRTDVNLNVTLEQRREAIRQMSEVLAPYREAKAAISAMVYKRLQEMRAAEGNAVRNHCTGGAANQNGLGPKMAFIPRLPRRRRRP